MVRRCLGMVSAVVLGVILGWAQTAPPPPQPPSLGDAARKVRAQKTGKSKWVFTNDNMPHSAEPAPVPPAGDTKIQPATGAPAAAAEKKPEEKKDSAAEEKEWRAKFAKMRETLEYEERKLDVLQRELNLAQVQNYSDPNQAMREQFARTEINKRTAEIDAQKQKVDAAKKAIADAEEELRRKSLPAGWAR